MKKFSKILESVESEIVQDIKDIFIEFTDKGFSIKVDVLQDIIYNIYLTKKDKDFDPMWCINELTLCDKKLKNILNLEYKDSLKIKLDKNETYTPGNIHLRYSGDEDKLNLDNINDWDSFKTYLNDVLNVDGIEGDNFRINVANKHGWGRTDDYHGWDIESYFEDNKIENMKKHYPGYDDFWEKVLTRKLNYDGLWSGSPHHDIDPNFSKENNALKFDKEGIEVVKTLIKMEKDFPGKIKVYKPGEPRNHKF